MVNAIWVGDAVVLKMQCPFVIFVTANLSINGTGNGLPRRHILYPSEWKKKNRPSELIKWGPWKRQFRRFRGVNWSVGVMNPESWGHHLSEQWQRKTKGAELSVGSEPGVRASPGPQGSVLPLPSLGDLPLWGCFSEFSCFQRRLWQWSLIINNFCYFKNLGNTWVYSHCKRVYWYREVNKQNVNRLL